jgi:hypothetical protein
MNLSYNIAKKKGTCISVNTVVFQCIINSFLRILLLTK